MLNLCAFKITAMGIQDRIAQAVNESGMSKSAIAKACSVSPSAVTMWGDKIPLLRLPFQFAEIISVCCLTYAFSMLKLNHTNTAQPVQGLPGRRSLTARSKTHAAIPYAETSRPQRGTALRGAP